MFNEEQQAYMRYLASVPREERCRCGWCLLGDCFNSACLDQRRKPGTLYRRGRSVFREGGFGPVAVCTSDEAAEAALRLVAIESGAHDRDGRGPEGAPR